MFIRSLPVHSLGGLETYTWNLANGLASRGHKITLVTKMHPKGITHETINENLEVYYCGREGNDWYSESFLKESAELFQNLNSVSRFDIIHSQSGGAEGLIFFNIKITSPLIGTIHGYWKNEYRNAFRRHRLRPILSAIRTYIKFKFSKKKRNELSDWFKHFQKTILINQANYDHYSRDFPQYKNTFVKIYTGIDTNKFQPMNVDVFKKELHLESKRVLIFAGRIDDLKGMQYILPLVPKIALTYPDIKLLLIGEGPLRPHLEKQVKKFHIEPYVQFMGYIPNDQLPKYLNLGEMFLFPAAGFEGLPLNCIEAISCGLPVLAIKTEGVVDIVKHEINGFLIDYKNKKQFISYIQKLLSDRDLWKKMSLNARSIALNLFDFQKMIDNTIEVYNNLIN